MLNVKLYSAFFLIVAFLSCKKEIPLPKPKAYPRFDFPTQQGSIPFSTADCPFTFRYPDYVTIERDTLFFNETPDDPCWLNIKYSSLQGMIHLSYKSLQKHKLQTLTEEYHRLKNEHVRVAQYIDDSEIKDSKRAIYGLLSDLGGDTASAHQFYITDSTNHFIRGSLYFRSPPNADSLKPANLFVRKDILKLLESWEWQ